MMNNGKYFLLFALILCSCNTVHKSRRSETVSRDSSVHTSFSGVKTTKIEELAPRPVVFNPGNYSGLFDLRDTSGQVLEADGYTIEIKAGGKEEAKTGKGKIKVTGKDQKKEVPVNKTTTITEDGIRQDHIQVKETHTVKESAKDKTGTPGWLWPVGILIGLCVFGYIAFKLFR